MRIRLPAPKRNAARRQGSGGNRGSGPSPGRQERSGACGRDLGSCPATGADPAGGGRAGPGRRARRQADARDRPLTAGRQGGRTVTTTESNITKDMTPVEAANLLVKLEDGHQAAWLSTREVRWPSAEYESRFQNAAEVDDVFRDLMWETVENGMRRPGEPVEQFAERAESEAMLADARKAGAETPADLIIEQADAGMTPERAGSSQDEISHPPAERRDHPGGPGIRQGVLGHRRGRREGAAGAGSAARARPHAGCPPPRSVPRQPRLARERARHLHPPQPEPQVSPEHELEAGS